MKWALTAMLLLCGGAAPATQPSLPAWLLGTWAPYEIRQNKNVRYGPTDGPLLWYKDSNLTIRPDQLTFATFACDVGSVQPKTGPLSTPTRAVAGGRPDAFDLPQERRPVEYLQIHCARSLTDMGDGKGIVAEITPALTWYIVIRSRAEIELPFLGGAYIKLRPAP